jgi:hypothetical protein
MRHHYRLLALLVGVALSATGFVATSAQAAVKTTVSGRVVDATTGDALRGIQVYAVNVDDIEGEDEDSDFYDENEGFAYLFATDSDGEFSGRAGGRLAPGTWVFGFQDSNGSYVSTSQEITLTEGANSFDGDITMTKGGTVRGTVTAPSGAELKGVEVWTYDPSEDDGDEGDGDDYSDLFFELPYGDTDRDGSYELRGIPAGSYVLEAGFEEGKSPAPVPFTISGPNDTADVNVEDVQVPVTTHISGRTSSNKGRAGVSFRVDASQFGIDLAGGTVRLKDGSKTLKSAAEISGNRVSFSLGGLKKGTHTFHVKYLGGVDTQRAETISVKVKVK